MAGETDLGRLLAGMRPALRPGTFVFATIAAGERAPESIDPVMTFRESEGLTLILTIEEASRAGLSATFPSRLITLEIHSALDAVGFLAAVTTRLAARGIGVNPVAAFHHDHLFVPAERAEEALEALKALAEESAGALAVE
jgi:hypothetical protein